MNYKRVAEPTSDRRYINLAMGKYSVLTRRAKWPSDRKRILLKLTPIGTHLLWVKIKSYDKLLVTPFRRAQSESE